MGGRPPLCRIMLACFSGQGGPPFVLASRTCRKLLGPDVDLSSGSFVGALAEHVLDGFLFEVLAAHRPVCEPLSEPFGAFGAVARRCEVGEDIPDALLRPSNEVEPTNLGVALRCLHRGGSDNIGGSSKLTGTV